MVRLGGVAPTDAALAAAALLLVQAEIWTTDVQGSFPALVVGGLLVSVPLAWRQVAPLASGGLVCAGWFVMTSAATGDFPPQVPVLPVTVAVYSAAAWTRGTSRAALAGAVTLGLMVAAYLAAPEADVDDFFPYAVWAGAFGTGRLVQRRSAEATRAATRAAASELAREVAEQEATERERARIARDLHDVVGHSVSLMVVQAGAERLRLGSGGPTAEALLRIEDAGREALRDLRAMLGVMGPGDGRTDDPAGLAPLPVIDDLDALVERLRGAGLTATVRMEGARDEVAGGVQVAVYRVVQEALTNVVRHAPGAAVTVAVEVSNGQVDLRVDNDCASPAVREGRAVRNGGGGEGSGRGLIGMRERVAAHGGTLTAGPRPGGGFRVAATIPGPS